MSLNKKFYCGGIVLIGILVLLSASGLFSGNDLRSLDLWRSDHRPHPDLLLVAIDNKSISEVGRWPWNRSVHADFLNSLYQYTPRLVAYDINFSEGESDVEDSAFSYAIDNATFPVVLSTQAVFLKGQELPESFSKPVIYAKHLGHVNVVQDKDGVVRKFPRNLALGSEEILPFSLKIAQLLNAEELPENNHFIDFSGSAGTFPTISYSDILNHRVEGEKLKDKIILVGATASDLRDYLLAPVNGGILSGVEWHANVVDNVLLSKGIKLLPEYFTIFLGLIVWFALLLFPLRWKTFLVLKIFIGLSVCLVLSSYILWQFGFALPYLVNLLGLTLIFVIRSAYKWYEVEMEKRRLRKTIENRFSPQVIEAIMKDPKLLRLGGERKEVAVLFSDIRSFTTISESLKPEDLSKLLHEYFTEMTEEVLATNGVLDKFIGDAVMAFWGAPLPQGDSAERAVLTAKGMMRRLQKLQKKWEKEGLPYIDIGIGIHFGFATVGNMGSEKRFDYTVIGDTVNVASRLEGLNKEYKTNIIISKDVLEKLKSDISKKSLGFVTVKGKTQSIEIFEVEV